MGLEHMRTRALKAGIRGPKVNRGVMQHPAWVWHSSFVQRASGVRPLGAKVPKVAEGSTVHIPVWTLTSW